MAERFRTAGLTGASRHVLALYYPWYGTPERSGSWSHNFTVNAAQKKIFLHTNSPASGPYDSADPAVIERHLAQAQAAGIDTLVCSWWGRQDGTDKAVRLLLAKAPVHGMHVCVYWERLDKPLGGPSAAREELNYLLNTFGKQPGYLREQGKPVVFLGSAGQSLNAPQWAEILNGINRTSAPGMLAIGQEVSPTDLLLWDGTYTFGVIPQMAAQSVAESANRQHIALATRGLLGRKLGRLTVATLIPGHDDYRPNLAVGIQTGTLVGREKGALYQALWEQTLHDGPDWVLIDSFNQWHAGTEIEPSLEYGDQYLTLTRTYAAQFKKAVGAESQSRVASRLPSVTAHSIAAKLRNH